MRPRVALVDENGTDLASAHPSLVHVAEESIFASAVVIEGVVTGQTSHSGRGATLTTRGRIGRFLLVMPRRGTAEITGPRGDPAGEPPPPPRSSGDPSAQDEIAPREAARGFVATDLLWLDGLSLLELPLLERKRLLHSVVDERPSIRLTPFVHPPFSPWLASWKSVGFRGGIAKGANSRYLPGAETTEWAAVRTLRPKT